MFSEPNGARSMPSSGLFLLPLKQAAADESWLVSTTERLIFIPLVFQQPILQGIIPLWAKDKSDQWFGLLSLAIPFCHNKLCFQYISRSKSIADNACSYLSSRIKIVHFQYHSLAMCKRRQNKLCRVHLSQCFGFEGCLSTFPLSWKN